MPNSHANTIIIIANPVAEEVPCNTEWSLNSATHPHMDNAAKITMKLKLSSRATQDGSLALNSSRSALPTVFRLKRRNTKARPNQKSGTANARRFSKPFTPGSPFCQSPP